MLAHAIGWKLAEALLDGRAPDPAYEPPVIEPAASVPSAPIDPATGRPRRAPRPGDTSTRTLVAMALVAQGIAVKPEVLKTVEDDKTSNDTASTPRGADLLLPESRIAVLVNGCFLHGCDEHASATRSSTFWWAARIKAYRATYDHAVERLTVAGWTVITVWEHEDPMTAAERIAANEWPARPTWRQARRAHGLSFHHGGDRERVTHADAHNPGRQVMPKGSDNLKDPSIQRQATVTPHLRQTTSACRPLVGLARGT